MPVDRNWLIIHHKRQMQIGLQSRPKYNQSSDPLGRLYVCISQCRKQDTVVPEVSVAPQFSNGNVYTLPVSVLLMPAGHDSEYSIVLAFVRTTVSSCQLKSITLQQLGDTIVPMPWGKREAGKEDKKQEP